MQPKGKRYGWTGVLGTAISIKKKMVGRESFLSARCAGEVAVAIRSTAFVSDRLRKIFSKISKGKEKE
jgi:hypothetical protein